MSAMSGRVIHPVFALPGGVSKPLEPDLAARIIKSAPDLVEFAQFSLDLFRDAVLKDVMHATTLSLDHYALKTHYMGLVDKNNRVAFYRGDVRVVGTDGAELVRFRPADYLEHLGEHVEPWSYVKFPFLKKLGWTGFTEGPLSGLYRVGPLGRVNSADGMRTPKAQEQYEMMQAVLGDKPYHQTLAFHWARLIEALQAAETVEALIHDPTTKDQDVRTLPTSTPTEGVGIVEAPRGTLIHHYKTDPEGILTFVNLLVATVHNAGPIQMSVAKAAKGLIHGFNVNQGILNGVEMAFRAYDPCLACATHSLPGEMPLEIVICDSHGGVVERLSRSARGTVEKYPT